MKGAVTGFDIVPLSEVPNSVRVKGNKPSQAQLKRMPRKRDNGQNSLVPCEARQASDGVVSGVPPVCERNRNAKSATERPVG
jgi:hypothetical protein